MRRGRYPLSSKAVEGPPLSLESVDDVHGGDSFPLCVLSVSHGIPDDVLQEDLQDTAGLLVDEARDSFDTSTTSQTSNGWLGDALDVVTKDLPVTLGTSLPQAFTSFTATGHLSIKALSM